MVGDRLTILRSNFSGMMAQTPSSLGRVGVFATLHKITCTVPVHLRLEHSMLVGALKPKGMEMIYITGQSMVSLYVET